MDHPFQLCQFEAGAPPSLPLAHPARWFVFVGDRLLIQTTPQALVPEALDLDAVVQCSGLSMAATPPPPVPRFLGTLTGQPCYGLLLDQNARSASQDCQDDSLKPGYRLQPLKPLYGVLSEPDFALAGRAIQLLQWEHDHRFCSRCAQPLGSSAMADGWPARSRRCSRCGLRHDPRLSPAVIVRVTREDKILLARSPRFRPGLYSVLAGFVEPGESLEDTVAREVKEEVGVSLQNIQYFGSQPWPFPNSLMLAFTAEYAGGELQPEPQEIEDVAWFSRTTLPPIPGPLSIAHRLIHHWASHVI